MNIPNEMIERVARASFKCWRDRMTSQDRLLDRGQSFEDMDESEREFAFVHARVVIEAMREPTKKMLDTLSESIGGDAATSACWAAAIDEALK